MPRQFPTIEISPLLELSQQQDLNQDIGVSEFSMGDSYAAVELEPLNRQRMTTTWNWEDITVEQFEQLRGYFLSIGGDYILWTPEGQTTPTKWRPLPGAIRGAFRSFDNARVSLNVGQVFDNG